MRLQLDLRTNKFKREIHHKIILLHYINCQYFIYFMKPCRMSLVLLSISTTQAKLTVKIANTDTFVEVRNSGSDVNGVVK